MGLNLTVRYTDDNQLTYTDLSRGDYNLLFRIYAAMMKRGWLAIKAVFGEVR